MRTIFNEVVYQDIVNRINNLNEDTKPQWGKMNVGQMVWHCQAPLNIMLQKDDYGMKPNWLINLLFKKSLYSDKPYKKNGMTAKAFKTEESKDFTSEKNKLIGLLNELHDQREKTDWAPHPSFGTFTKDQWGKMQYKHLDHHLRQFGV